MKDFVTIDEVIYALRCTCSEGGMHKCKGLECPYCDITPMEERLGFCERNNIRMEDYPESFWQSCDLDGIGLDAAGYLEDMKP